jgi:hypothetical protein
MLLLRGRTAYEAADNNSEAGYVLPGQRMAGRCHACGLIDGGVRLVPLESQMLYTLACAGPRVEPEFEGPPTLKTSKKLIKQWGWKYSHTTTHTE